MSLLVAELPTEARHAIINDLQKVYPTLRTTAGTRLAALLELGWSAPQTGAAGGNGRADGPPTSPPVPTSTPVTTPAPTSGPATPDALDEATGRVLRFLTAELPPPPSPEAFALLFQGRTEAGAKLLKLLQGPPISHPPGGSVSLLVAELPTKARHAIINDLQKVYPTLRTTAGTRLAALLELGWSAPQTGAVGGKGRADAAAPVAIASVYRYLVHGPSAADTVKRVVEGTFPNLPAQNAEAIRVAQGKPVISITQDIVDLVVDALPHEGRQSLLDIAMEQEGWRAGAALRQRDLLDLGFLRVRADESRKSGPSSPPRVDARPVSTSPQRTQQEEALGRVLSSWGTTREPAQAAPPNAGAQWGCVALIAAIGLCWLIGKSRGSSGTGSSDSVGACVACMEFVKARLKAPSTADFPMCFNQTTTTLGSGEYRVIGYVDAQNSFGAKIRNDYTCVVKDKGGQNWSLLSLSGL